MAMLSVRGQNGTSGSMETKSPISNVHGVLKILNSRLGAEGNVRDPKDVAYFMVLMAEAVKLADRCMFVNVLRATKSHSILKVILDKGGWATLHLWLQQCRSEDANAFLYELLLLYKHVPVSVELLRQNSCAKDIKQLIKSSDDKIARLAKIIVANWVDKVKEKGSSDGNTGSKHADKSPSSHRHHHRVSSTDGADVSGSTHSSSSSKESSSKEKSTDKHSSSSSKTVKDDVDPSRIKTLEDSPDHITSKMNHRALSADRIHTTNDDSTSSSNSMSVDMDSAQPTSVHRPKTVKMIGSKMRSTGLELDTPLPPSKKSVSSPSDKDKQTHTSVANKSQSSKKVLLDKKPTAPATSSSSNGSLITSFLAPVEAKPKIKVIPPKPRQTEIYESSGFMDALICTDPVIGRRKRKLGAPATAAPGSSKTHGAATVPLSPDEKKQAPFSTMETDDGCKKSDTVDVSSQLAASDKPTSGEQVMEHSASGTVDTSDVKDDSGKESAVKLELTGETIDYKDNPTEPPSKKKKVKAVTWVDEAKLCSFFYFQLDENERVNVNKIQDFAEIRKHEQEMERHMMQNVRRMAHDVMAEKRAWKKPFLITGLTQVVNYGCNSKEKDVQRDRELGVLQILYFTKTSIPDSAVEPEAEYFELIEPKIIPLSDETGLGSEVKYDSYPGAAHPTSMTSLPPAIASLLSTTASQVQGAITGSSPLNPNLLPPQMSPTSSQPPQPLQPNVSLPPLHVFLGMAFPAQQHIFRAMPPHVQQQMMNSLPPVLQQQLAPLLSTPMTNGVPPGPVAMPPDVRPMGPGPMPFRPMGPGPNFQQRMPGGPGPMPRPQLMDPAMNGGRPFLPDGPMFPQRPPSNMMVRGPPMGANPSGRVCSHFLAGSCRYGNACKNLHPPRDGIPPGAPGLVAHDSLH